VSEFEEREYIKKVAGFKSVMPVDCPYCKKVWDHIDGGGHTGTTSRLCNDSVCQDQFQKAWTGA
jgi:hypothetical protein